MIWGDGHADHLRQFGIAVAADSPGIRANLHDHLLLPVYFASKEKMPPLMDIGLAGITYYKTRASMAGPNIQIFGRQEARGTTDPTPAGGYTIRAGPPEPPTRGN